MNKTIHSIREAHSMQPLILKITTQKEFDKKKNSEMEWERKNLGEYAKEIKLETQRVSTDKECDFYVGYNFEGKKVFEYLRSAVNVHYIETIH